MVGTFLLPSCGYNKIVEYEEAANSQWGKVESAYQRRTDLVPNLLRQAQGLSGLDQKAYNELQKAYKEMSSYQMVSEDLSKSEIKKYMSAQEEVESAIGTFMAALRLNPETADIYRDFQTQIEGAENRINFERMKYNEEVSTYNGYIRKAPQSFTSGCMGFDERPYFKAETE